MSILVATDGSDFARRGVAFAAETAARLHVPLHVCAVADYVEGSKLSRAAALGAPDLLRRDARHWLRDAQELCKAYKVKAHPHLFEDDVIDGILRCGRSVAADLIVVASHGRDGVARVVFGSTVQGVLRQTTVPVIVVPAQYRERPAERLERIMIAVDGSVAGRRAAATAFELAGQTGASVELCCVIDADRTVESDWADAVSTAELLLEAERTKAAEHGIRAGKRLLRGRVAGELLAFAQTHDIDLIVMGTHGRSGVSRALLGSVSASVIKQSTRPVLIARSPSGS